MKFVITVYMNGLAFGLEGRPFPSFYRNWFDLLEDQQIDRLLIPLVVRSKIDRIFLPR